MADKTTLPMDVSKGIQFDFTVEGITEEQAKALLDLIQAYMYPRGLVMAGGFFSVAHMEELSLEWGIRDGDLLDMVDDDISLDDLEEDEDNCNHGMPWYLCPRCDEYQSGPDDFE